MQEHPNKKWITLTDYIDVETGEIISKSKYEREYYKTGKTNNKYSENEKYRIRRIEIECRPNKQCKLW